jgi:sulfide:quinone oxidoreductase
MAFRVVIAGAGVAALETALALRALAEDLVTVELVAPEQEFTYRPLAVAEPFRVGEMRRFPLSTLVTATGAELRRGTVAQLDPDDNVALLQDGQALDFDAFVLALGARPREAVAGALTFRGSEDGSALSALLDRATEGDLRRIVFAVPAATTWPLPLYELALLTAGYLTDHGTRGVDVLLVTPEERPLALFGSEASEALQELLEIRGIELHFDAAPIAWRDGLLEVAGLPPIDADAVVALPRLVGPALPGLPHDGTGFVPTDAYGRVPGTAAVYAAGDCTQFPLKQGGIATQQADAVAAAIAADVEAGVESSPVRPVIRGLLLTGLVPRYLRSDTSTGRSVVDTEPLWWPPAKIVGRYLTPFLATQLGLASSLSETSRAAAVEVEVEVEVDPRDSASWSAI